MGHPTLKACGALPEQAAAHELPIPSARTEENLKALNAGIPSPPPNCPEKCRTRNAGIRTLLPTHMHGKNTDCGTCGRKSSAARKKNIPK